MIRLVLLGQPFWAQRLAGFLNGRPEAFEARFLAPGGAFTPSGLRTLLWADAFIRVGYRPAARTPRGRAFDAFWSLIRGLNRRAKGVHYWIGTDVLNTLEDHRAGRLRPGPLRKALGELHWADAPWLVEELAEVGLPSRYIALPVPLDDVRPPDHLPAPFTVLTYIPEARPGFYDGPTLVTVAEALPDVRFEVIGGTGAWAPRGLENLTFFGWQPDVRPFLERATVVVRLVRHDGMGGTVREALEAGRHVIYSQAMPHVTVVPFQDSQRLEAAIRELHGRFQRGELAPNRAGHDYVKATFDLGACLDDYHSDLSRLLGRSESLEDLVP